MLEVIIGRDVEVVVVDSAIEPFHKEFAENMKYNLMTNTVSPHFHGIIVAANLVGKSLGVVPESKLTYHEFVKLTKDTVHKSRNGLRVINPVEIIRSL